MVQSKDKLTLLTLNTHSLLMPDNEACLAAICDLLLRERVDVAAFQEVNQAAGNTALSADALREAGYVPASCECPLREGNWGLLLQERLQAAGERWQWTWAYAHRGYKTFEEGVAIFSRTPIMEAVERSISGPDIGDQAPLCRRKLLGVRTDPGAGATWFWSSHMGWWDDAVDPFRAQWERASETIRAKGGPAYCLGDFNSPAAKRGEGYDLITSGGWEDCYLRAEKRDAGATVLEPIDGWRKGGVEAMRIDFVFAAQPGRTLESRVVFDGRDTPVVSDHFGVLDVEAV